MNQAFDEACRDVYGIPLEILKEYASTNTELRDELEIAESFFYAGRASATVAFEAILEEL